MVGLSLLTHACIVYITPVVGQLLTSTGGRKCCTPDLWCCKRRGFWHLITTLWTFCTRLGANCLQSQDRDWHYRICWVCWGKEQHNNTSSFQGVLQQSIPEDMAKLQRVTSQEQWETLVEGNYLNISRQRCFSPWMYKVSFINSDEGHWFQQVHLQSFSPSSRPKNLGEANTTQWS